MASRVSLARNSVHLSQARMPAHQGHAVHVQHLPPGPHRAWRFRHYTHHPHPAALPASSLSATGLIGALASSQPGAARPPREQQDTEEEKTKPSSELTRPGAGVAEAPATRPRPRGGFEVTPAPARV